MTAGLIVLTLIGLEVLLATSHSTLQNVPAGPAALSNARIFSSQVQRPPPAFYTPPLPLPDALPGTVRRSEDILNAPNGVTATRISVRVDQGHGTPAASSPMIAMLSSDPPPGARPVVEAFVPAPRIGIVVVLAISALIKLIAGYHARPEAEHRANPQPVTGSVAA